MSTHHPALSYINILLCLIQIFLKKQNSIDTVKFLHFVLLFPRGKDQIKCGIHYPMPFYDFRRGRKQPDLVRKEEERTPALIPLVMCSVLYLVF